MHVWGRGVLRVRVLKAVFQGEGVESYTESAQRNSFTGSVSIVADNFDE